MKHLWFGAGLLAALLALGLWVGPRVEQTYDVPAKDLDRAAEAVWEDNWPLAQALFSRAKNHWQSHRGLTAALAHHAPIEQIDSNFTTTQIYLKQRDSTAFCAACAELSGNLRSLPQSHSFRWWNLL